MSASPQKDAGMVPSKTALYRETIPFGKVYHGVMGCVIFLLTAGIIVFWLTSLWPGVIALAVTLPFVIWIYIGCRKTQMAVTHERFVLRYWFVKFAAPLKEIASVQVRDEIILPPSYVGHIKVGWGWHSWQDLKVMVCRSGLPLLEVKTKDGVTIIVTPLHADKLAQVLNQRIEASLHQGK